MKPSEPRERLLRTASDLFYREGIHSIGVDRIVAEASVTRATFYRHFPGKEALVEAYLGVEDALIRGLFAAAADSGAPAAEQLEMLIEGLAVDIERNHTRGCPFINAAAEYPDAASPVRRSVAAHRTWFRGVLRQVLQDAGAADPDEAAGELVLLRDAAMIGGYLDGWNSVRPPFIAASRRVASLLTPEHASAHRAKNPGKSRQQTRLAATVAS